MSARPPLRIATVEIDGTVTRPLLLDRPFGETMFRALKEAMLKRGCLRDRAHKGQCLGCALVPECAVWPLVAPGDPTRRQRGSYLRPFVLRLPALQSARLPVGTHLTWGATIVQDTRFPAKWSMFASAFADAARQLAEWGIGAPVRLGEQASRRGAIAVSRLRWVQPLTGATEPFTASVERADSIPLMATWSEPNTDTAPPQTIRLTFITPTRLVAAGQTVRIPEPSLLVRRIAERLDTVAETVGADPPNLLADDLLLDRAGRLAIAHDETQWEGDPARGGFVGAVTLSGATDDIAAVKLVLQWGAALGVGKGTLEGAGRFVMGDVPQTARVIAETSPESGPKVPATHTEPSRARGQGDGRDGSRSNTRRDFPRGPQRKR